MTPRIKVCGITRVEDASEAVRLGATALGFVFWPKSPRAVSVQAAREIARAVPPFVARVGVFVDASVEDVTRIAGDLGLDGVQLHGDERVDRYDGVKARLIKAVFLESGDDVERAATLAARRPIILAGGLTPENVPIAINCVRPWALDVSSGVESAPGIKSHERLAAFFAAVANARGGEPS